MRGKDVRARYFSQRATEYRRKAIERSVERREVRESQRDLQKDLQERFEALYQRPQTEEPPF